MRLHSSGGQHGGGSAQILGLSVTLAHHLILVCLVGDHGGACVLGLPGGFRESAHRES